MPADRYYGSQTARAMQTFPHIDPMPEPVIRALAAVKKAAALVNHELGLLPADKARLIMTAADEVIAGRLSDHYPLSVWQSGSGTQSNMNVNEVIANRAIELTGGTIGSKSPVHPNDDVNKSQSSNDVFPTAMHVATAVELRGQLFPAVERLADALGKKAREFADIIKMGRTHLQDATPLTVGQEFSGWESLIRRDLDRLRTAFDGLGDLAIGGTAVGTGINAPPDFGARVAAKLAEWTGISFRPHPNKFAALSSHDELVFVSAALRSLAASLLKIANDVRWLASGPRSGLGELLLPENEPGSSIMPGKVNPTQCEVVAMAAVQVFGFDAAVAFAGSQGQLQLNTFKPLIVGNVLNSIRLLSAVVDRFVEHCLAGIDVDRAHVAHHVENSLMLATALAPVIGYDNAAKLARQAVLDHSSLRDANRKLGFVSEEDFTRLTRPESMIGR